MLLFRAAGPSQISLRNSREIRCGYLRNTILMMQSSISGDDVDNAFKSLRVKNDMII